MRPYACLLTVAIAATIARAEDWPQALGPMRNNRTSEAVPAWTTPPRELWRARFGESNSNAIVADGRVFLHCKIQDREAEELIALDAATGTVLWRRGYPREPYTSTTGNGPRATPATALGRVVTYGVTGMLTCYTTATGEQLWQVDTRSTFGVGALRYGVTSSPLIEGNRVLVHLGGSHGAIAAFDLENGSVVWKGLDDPVSTSSPTVVEFANGQRHIAFQTALRIVGVDALSGALIWEHPLSDTPLDSIAAPFWTGSSLITSSVAFGGKAVGIAAEAGRFRATELWRNEELGSYFQSGVPMPEKRCYFIVTNRQQPGATLRCVDLETGAVRWSKPSVADWHAGLIATGTSGLLLSDGKGSLSLVAADPHAFVELARTDVPGLASSVNPVVANGRVYLRGQETIVCLAIGRP
ncbi:MAG: PQQ-binding-like beta-propeller repeat protein [Actinomycetota bacterium]